MFEFERDINKTRKMGSIRKIVTTFFVPYRSIGDIKIDIYEYEDGHYVGDCEYSIWTPTQGDAYKSMDSQKSVEKALNDALLAFKHYDRDEYPNEVVFLQDKEGNNFDANGRETTYEQVKKIFEEYNINNK